MVLKILDLGLFVPCFPAFLTSLDPYGLITVLSNSGGWLLKTGFLCSSERKAESPEVRRMMCSWPNCKRYTFQRTQGTKEERRDSTFIVQHRFQIFEMLLWNSFYNESLERSFRHFAIILPLDLSEILDICGTNSAFCASTYLKMKCSKNVHITRRCLNPLWTSIMFWFFQNRKSMLPQSV